MPDVCPTHPELADYILGKLPRERCEEIDMHLDECVICLAELETQGDADDTFLSRLRVGESAEKLLVDVECADLMDRVAAIGREPSFTTQRQLAEATASPTELGDIGPYRLLATLGAGGMGTVYKAFHPKLKRVVALKVLPAERMQDQQAIQRFEREMEAVGKLDHRNIVRATDAGEHDGKHFLVMEYVEGIDLSELSRSRGPLPIADACELIRQAAVGLQHAHENGLVHRDIKPSNLMLKSDGNVKILDLGLALLPEQLGEGSELTSTGQAMGTLDYMAPEQGGDSHDVDIRADIYALGATLYKLLTGQAIYAGPNYKTIMDKWRALATEEAQPIQTRRPEVPDALAAVVHRMLARHADERFTTPQEVAEALAPFCAGADLSAMAEVQTPLPEEDVSKSTTSLLKESASLDTSLRPRKSANESPTQPLVAKPKTKAARRKTSPVLIALGLLGIVALVAAMVFYFQTPHGTLRVEIDDPEIEVMVKGQNIVITGADKEPIKLQAGEHTLIVTRGDDFTFETNQLILKKNEIAAVKVELLPGKVQVVHGGRVIGERGIGELQTSHAGFALAFNGESGHVEVPTLRYDGSHPLTVEAWCRLDGRNNTRRYILMGDYEAGGWAVGAVNMPTSQLQWTFTVARPNHNRNLCPDPVGEGWTHVAGVLDDSSSRLYLNGRLAATLADLDAEFTPAVTPFCIGANPGGMTAEGVTSHSESFHGPIRAVRISKVARYQQAFTPKRDFQPDADTLAVYTFSEGSGNVLRDSSGNGHHGKIVGAKWVKAGESAFDPTYAADRGAALAVLAKGGQVLVKRAADGIQIDWLDQQESLPEEPFYLTGVNLRVILQSDDDLRLFRELSQLEVLNLGVSQSSKEPGLSDAGLAHLARLSSLRTLDLSGHPRITDAGLVHLAGLTQLVHLGLGDTKVTGSGLRHLRDCPMLLQLVLTRSRVTDEGLAQLPALPSLYHLDLGGTKITDPSLAHLEQQPQLRALSLANVRLSEDGMAALARLRGLTNLNLMGCDIQGGWRHLSALADLQVLSLYGNPSFADDDLEALAGLSKLETLNLLGTSVSDERLPWLQSQKSLRELSLEKTKVTKAGITTLSQALPACRIIWDGGVIEPKLSADRRAAQWVLGLGGQVVIRPRDGAADRTLEPGDKLPETAFDLQNIFLVGNQQVTDDDLANYVSGLEHLKWLWLRETNVTDAGMVALRDMPNLQCVNLYNTKVGDETLKHLSQFPKIWELTLYNTNITDDGMAHLAALPNLKILFANTPNTGDDGLRHVAGLTEMLWLHLGAKTTDEGLKHLANLRQLEELSLAGTQVTGSGFVHLREMSQLRNINAIATPLNPASLAHLQALPDLKVLYLGVTNLSDDGLAHVKPLKLERLNLDRNPITDAGLEHLREMKTLREVFLTRTEVTEEGVKKLSESLPACRITWDGGVIEPKDSADRRAAEWVLSLDGVVSIESGGQRRVVASAAGLPDDDFRLVSANLYHEGQARSQQVGDAELPNLKSLSHLAELHLSGTRVTDDGLRELAGLKGLIYLTLNGTAVTDAGLEQLHGLTQLTSLHLISTRVGDEGLVHLQQFKNLADLHLSGTRVTNAGLPHLTKLEHLAELTLNGTPVTDDGLVHLGKLPHLSHLSLTRSKITDAGLVHLQGLKQLRDLQLSKSQVTAEGIARLKKALPDCQITSDFADEQSEARVKEQSELHGR